MEPSGSSKRSMGRSTYVREGSASNKTDGERLGMCADGVLEGSASLSLVFPSPCLLTRNVRGGIIVGSEMLAGPCFWWWQLNASGWTGASFRICPCPGAGIGACLCRMCRRRSATSLVSGPLNLGCVWPGAGQAVVPSKSQS